MNTKFAKVALLQGGSSSEREISLASAEMIGAALDEICTTVVRFDPAHRKICELAELDLDCVFNILHGGSGEDGRMQAALELLGLPYTGSRHLACALAMDKEFSKIIWTDVGLPTPMWYVARDHTEATLDTIQLELGEDLFVKPNSGGSSVATRLVSNRTSLKEAIVAALAEDEKVLIEQRIEGFELTYGVLGDELLPGIRIETDNSFYDYAAKYELDTTRYICPPNLPPQLDKQISTISLQAFTALGCSGWGRVDLMISGRDIYLLEVNTIPGMTSHSLVPKAAAAAAIESTELVRRILELAQ